MMENAPSSASPVIPPGKCRRCLGTGSILADISYIYGNRTERRKAKRAKCPMEKYLTCPVCGGRGR